MASVLEPYNLDPDFEKAVLYFCATKPNFWKRLGYILDPVLVEVSGGKLLLETCRAIARESGHGPNSPILVVQHLKRKQSAGKVTQAEIEELVDLFDYVEDCGLPDEEIVISELIPVVQRRLHSQAILQAHDEYAKRGDMVAVRTLLDKSATLGLTEQVPSTRLGAAGFRVIERALTTTRLSTGVLELDLKLDGGMPKKCMGGWLGDSGGGKSMGLVTQACVGVQAQMFVGFATLELPEHIQMARLTSHLTGVPWGDILSIDHLKKEAERRMSIIEPYIGILELAEFPPHATTVEDLIEWVDQQEQKYSQKMELLVVDYGDKLHTPKVREDNTYLAMRYVYEGLRRKIAVDRDMWVWTASQASRPSKESNKRIDLHHVADSMHKARSIDTMISLNPREDGTMELFVAKNRLGVSRFMVGPLTTDFARARLTPFSKELGPW